MPPDTDSTEPESEESTKMTLEMFLETVPPNNETVVNGGDYVVPKPIRLYCANEECESVTFFDTEKDSFSVEDSKYILLRYTCRHCRETTKFYPVVFRYVRKEMIVMKMGETPAFGPTLPPRLVTLLGPDRDYLLKGRKSEAFGLGIAAYAYYRRVVEKQKDRLFDQIISVAEKIGASADTIATLKTARKEKQFTKAFELERDAVPEALKIAGHNPLLVCMTR